MTTPSRPGLRDVKGGQYSLLRKLGEGSQGETYEALDHGAGPDAGRVSGGASGSPALADKWARYVREQRTGGEVPRDARLVAIKCFRVGTAKAWKDVELAEREARTLSSLAHPRLPRYFEHFEESGALYLVMEKIEGESLAALRAQGRTMSAAEITRMLEDIGDALRYLHGRAPLVVHRDIKPGNVIRRPDGSFALVDFGAVRDRLKPAGGSTVVGTFGYMAPEQFQGRASPKSDVYGLGATAMTMLTGTEPEELPHEGLGIDVAHALPKGTPAGLARALTAMLVPDPDRRVASVEEALALVHAKGQNRKPKAGARERDTNEAPTLTKKQRRRLARDQAKELGTTTRDQRLLAARRAARAASRPPLIARFFGRLGLLVALVAVWLTVGFLVPVVLILLSLLFGEALRRAAAACVRAARQSQAALGRASMWLSGYVPEPNAAAPAPGRVRVAADAHRVRAVVEASDRHGEGEADVEAAAEHADAWMEERLEKEAQRERMRQQARAPAKRRFWGR